MTRRAARAALSPALLFTVLVAVTTPIGLDYYADAQPGIQALADGDLPGWAAAQPQMGQLSIVLRAPVAALGLGELWTYRLGALVLLLGPVLLLAYLRATMPRPSRTLALGLTAVLCLNPITLRALHLGHPEEALGGALCALALLLALDRRAGWAGLALGLALGTKQWALLAVLPVLFACADGVQRRRLLVFAVPVAALLTLPPILMDPHAFADSMARPIAGLSIMRPANLWSLVVPQDAIDGGSGAVIMLAVVPSWLRSLAHPLVIGVALMLAVRWRETSRMHPPSALALLALVFLMRCVLDPWNHGYYHWPFLAALICWEVRGRGRVPVVAAVSSAWLAVSFTFLHGPVLEAGYMLWAVTVLGWLTHEAFAPARAAVPVAVAAPTGP